MGPPRFRSIRPGAPPGAAGRWFRRFVEVRDGRRGAGARLASAAARARDRRHPLRRSYRPSVPRRRHTLDFVNKALEALDLAGWDRAEAVLASLRRSSPSPSDGGGESWRNPVDVVALPSRR